ncbi:hypothetical protein K466DRAFT_69414 [Polyporus arcularius HHB13444]|uniref:Uncharacterized protein n=1 Tax=Polyporus arcularius HHB13444 TaxID=1314778 RepID=A0A5C3PGY3_9APHY|nr:hypothetical protein K466DRAFT_69414 [Polyporus arcularius HHB13444]
MMFVDCECSGVYRLRGAVCWSYVLTTGVYIRFLDSQNHFTRQRGYLGMRSLALEISLGLNYCGPFAPWDATDCQLVHFSSLTGTRLGLAWLESSSQLNCSDVVPGSTCLVTVSNECAFSQEGP